MDVYLVNWFVRLDRNVFELSHVLEYIDLLDAQRWGEIPLFWLYSFVHLISHSGWFDCSHSQSRAVCICHLIGMRADRGGDDNAHSHISQCPIHPISEVR